MEDAASGVPSSDELAAGAEAAAFNAAENVDGGVRRAALILFAANGKAGLVRTAAGGFGGDGAVRSCSSRGDVGEPGGGRACKKKRTAEVRCLEIVLVFICRGEANGSSRSSFLKVGELTGRASLSKCDESATPS